jgi:hypothetical protein
MNARNGSYVLLLLGALLIACTSGPSEPSVTRTAEGAEASVAAAGVWETIPVSGSAVHFFTTAVVHSQDPTEGGMVQRSTEIIELSGDLAGYILYHPTSTFDFVSETLVNTGTQVFSGTVAGSAPVLLHDDRFHFEVDLATGETHGRVHLSRSADAPHRGGWYECDLEVVGTGLTAEGDGMADYSGVCRRRGAPD